MASRLFLTRTFKLIIGFFGSMAGFRGLHVLRWNVSAAAAAADSGHLLLLCFENGNVVHTSFQSIKRTYLSNT